MAITKSDKWKGVTGGGNFGQKFLIFLFKHCDVRVGYFFMYLTIPFYILFGRKARKAVMHYFQKVYGYKSLKALWNTWKTYNNFGKIIMDRFSMFSGQKHKFKIQENGNENFYRLAAQKSGFMMVGSHTGNFEICGYLLKQNIKKIYALVYGGESEILKRQRFMQFCENNVEMVAVENDMSHLFKINAALENGDIVTMPADRALGSKKTIKCKFGLSEAEFPTGPFSVAAIRGVPVLAVFVFREKTYQYKLIVKELKADEEPVARKKAALLAQKFAAELEEQIKNYQCQWFNFFEFFE
jgi:predicted LPLAT superfamily acyltransferase